MGLWERARWHAHRAERLAELAAEVRARAERVAGLLDHSAVEVARSSWVGPAADGAHDQLATQRARLRRLAARLLDESAAIDAAAERERSTAAELRRMAQVAA